MSVQRPVGAGPPGTARKLAGGAADFAGSSLRSRVGQFDARASVDFRFATMRHSAVVVPVVFRGEDRVAAASSCAAMD